MWNEAIDCFSGAGSPKFSHIQFLFFACPFSHAHSSAQMRFRTQHMSQGGAKQHSINACMSRCHALLVVKRRGRHKPGFLRLLNLADSMHAGMNVPSLKAANHRFLSLLQMICNCRNNALHVIGRSGCAGVRVNAQERACAAFAPGSWVEDERHLPAASPPSPHNRRP